jgi:hypothetical protein
MLADTPIRRAIANIITVAVYPIDGARDRTLMRTREKHEMTNFVSA